MRCTRKGGSTIETSIESSTRTRLEAEPCSTLRLCDICHLQQAGPHPTFATLFDEVQVPSQCVKRLLPQNYYKPNLLNNSETNAFELGHHKATLVLSDEPGMRLQDDRVGVL